MQIMMVKKLKERAQVVHVKFLENLSYLGVAENKVSLPSLPQEEYVAGTICCSQILWIRNQLGYFSLKYSGILIFCDNTSAINVSKNPNQHFKSKHIDPYHIELLNPYHFIRDHIQKKEIELVFVYMKH